MTGGFAARLLLAVLLWATLVGLAYLLGVA